MARPRAGLGIAVCAVGLAFALTPACGKKGGILPPLTLVPQTVESLSAVQRGGLVLLTWANHGAYIDGRALEGISEIEVWLEERPDPPAVAAKPAAPAGPFETRAKRVAVLTGALKPGVKPAAGSRGRAPAKPAPAAKAAAPNALYVYRLDPKAWTGRSLVFGLRARDTAKNLLSEFSPELSFRPKALSTPPENVRAVVFADRVEIRWDMPAGNFDGSIPPLVKGFNVYRGEPGGAARRVNSGLAAGTVFADRDVIFGRTYEYFVRVAGAAAEPFLESEDSGTVEVKPKDVFAPAVPAGVSAVKGPDFITLVWDAVLDPDAAGYRVWRRVKGKAEFACLTASPVPEPTYTDKSVEKSVTYEYAITSMDTAGNESAKSAVVAETIRMPSP